MSSSHSFIYTLSLLLTVSTSTFAAPSHGSHHSFHARASAPSYTLRDAYTPSNFFSSFDFATGPDPTHGFVNYLSSSAAHASNLTSTTNNQILLHVDHTNIASSSGRPSLRLTSKTAYTHGLFIADIAHMPASTCGSWPAFWLFGADWPNSGEIDIIEGVNGQSTNAMTLHTGPGCVVDNLGSLPGTRTVGADCNANSGYDGCSVATQDERGYGTGFNAVGGGVYAMQWESSGVYVWFFPRGAVPKDITDGRPVTANWGLPVAAFNGGDGCDVDAHLGDMNIVFSTTFCGDWAGGAWASGSCKGLGSCEAWVANNPSAFVDSYWLINSLKVYQLS